MSARPIITYDGPVKLWTIAAGVVPLAWFAATACGPKQVCECAALAGGMPPCSEAEAAYKSNEVSQCLARHGGGTTTGCPQPASMPVACPPMQQPAPSSSPHASSESAASASATPDSASPASSADDSDVAPTPTELDVRILHRADELLADASRWEHGGDRECPSGARSWNLYCAIHQASLDVSGTFQHRSAAMQEVRWVVDERLHGQQLGHRLMGYNNLPTTTFADIKSLLAEAATRIEAKLRSR
jgi:hypothetical protein